MKFTIAMDAYGQQYIYRNGSLIALKAYKSKKAIERFIAECAGSKAFTIEYTER